MASQDGTSSVDKLPKGRGKRISAQPPVQLQPTTAFAITLAVRLFAAIYSPIQDCDEVFNYWEPTHYLNHQYGLQTWEYSPEYAIRSWTYTGLHAIPIELVKRLPFMTKRGEFYFLRIFLAVLCAISEIRLYSAISRAINHRVAIFFLIAMISSAGMFHASAAYLPSSFAMYAVMNGMAAFVDWRGGLKTALGIFWFGLGSVIGWPFAGALIVPFLLEEVLLASINEQMIELFQRVLDGSMRSLIVLILQACIDTFFYRKIVVVPWNIIKYNIFGGSGKGPDIYGTEPWHFYIRNLLINFNLWFLLACTTFPLLLWQHFMRRQSLARASVLRGVVFASPFYLWLAIFTIQPHKEERFIYPAYPALALNAAISMHILLATIGSTNPRNIVSKIPASIKLAAASVFVLVSINLGIARSFGLVSNYSAPLSVYDPLVKPGVSFRGDNVCLGKEWYRFPSSYLLPNGVKAKFIRSGFTGLLPGEFSEAKVGFGIFPGAWLTPSGMNDENIEDPGKYIDVTHCKFLVDSFSPGVMPSTLEPEYIQDTESWEKLKCEKFLDTSQTGILGRLFFLPDLEIIPTRLRRKWGQYCLLRRRE